MSVIVGSASIRTHDDLHVGSASVATEDSISGCGCSYKIKIISWKECDTLSKKIGFIFGKAINATLSVCSKIINGATKIAKFCYIKKVGDVFYEIIRDIKTKINSLISKISKIKNHVSNFFNNYIQPIFINQFTKKVVTVVHSYLINPILNIIKTIFTKIYRKTVKSVHATNVPSKISKVFNEFLNIIKPIIKPIYNWTIAPFANRILRPTLKVIGDIIIGTIGGCSKKDNDVEEQPNA